MWPSRRRSDGPPPSISQYHSANVPRFAAQMAADPAEQGWRLDDAVDQLPDEEDRAQEHGGGQDHQRGHAQVAADVVATADARQRQRHDQDRRSPPAGPGASSETSSWVEAIASRSPTTTSATVAGQRGTPAGGPSAGRSSDGSGAADGRHQADSVARPASPSCHACAVAARRPRLPSSDGLRPVPAQLSVTARRPRDSMPPPRSPSGSAGRRSGRPTTSSWPHADRGRVRAHLRGHPDPRLARRPASRASASARA